ncbi:hypothetical protein SE23_15885 [Vibrio sinaloensis]|nr:hypothetical protein SE23_15885 [Vibrio sinaloensis]
MDDVMNESHATVPQQQGRKSKYVVYDWAMNLKTQAFYCDNEGQTLMFGEVYSTFSATRLIRLVPPGQRDRVKRAFQTALTTGEDCYLHCCLVTPTSLFTFVEIYMYKADEHHLKGTISPCLVISNAQEASEIFYGIFENQHHGVVVTDSDTRILACNHYFEKMTGYLRNELVGLKTNIFNSSSHDDEHYRALWESLGSQGYWSGVLLSRHAQGKVFPQSLTIQKIGLGSGEDYYIGLSTDLSSDLDRLEDTQSGGVDILTQLPTSDHFLAQLTKRCKATDRDNTLLVLAIQPRFASKGTNEQKKRFAAYLKEKTSALFSGYMDSGRFLACLPVVVEHPEQRVRDIAKTLTTFFHCFKHATKDIHEVLKTGLLGVSIYGVDAETPNRLVSHACQAILELHSGENRRIAFYDRSIHLQIERKKRLEAHVQKSMLNKNVEVYFQPIVSVKQQCVEKFEALCRFPPLESEPATTQDYIQVAEDMGKIFELDNLVCGMAFEQFKALQKRFGDTLQLSVNRSLNTDVGIADVLKHTALALDDAGLSPDCLNIEFTESAFLDNSDNSQQLIQTLRDAGVKIAVDDFGSGCASFHYLTKSFFDVLKIDRQFISGLEKGTREYHIVHTLVHLAHQLNLDVVAEGVETESELALLTELGVDYIQGYLFAKPESTDQIVAHEHYCQWPKTAPSAPEQTLMKLVSKNSHHLDPGDPLSLAHQYFNVSHGDYLAVVDNKKCVGVLSRSTMHLHMTPTMGTDLETSKEKNYWHKSVNRMMAPGGTVLDWHTPVKEVHRLVTQGTPLPWILTDELGVFKGLVEMATVLSFCVED